MSFINLQTIRQVLSNTIPGLGDAPADETTYGRFEGEWFDTFGIVKIPPAAPFNFTDDFWEIHTGNYSAVAISGASISNAPFVTKATETYSFIIESIEGTDGAKQMLTVTSTDFTGQRCYIRTAPTLAAITANEWKNVTMAFLQDAVLDTVDNSFTTLLTHALSSGTKERLAFTVFGERTSGGSGNAAMEIEAYAVNVAGVTTVIGSTMIYRHRDVNTVTARVIDNGSSNCLLQVRGSNNDWSWRGEVLFNSVVV